MAFDLKSAKPATKGGFDLKSARPVDNRRASQVAAPDPAVENDRKKTAASIAAAQKLIAGLTQQLQSPVIQSNPDRYRAIEAAINGQKEALRVNQDRIDYLNKNNKLPPGLTASGGISDFLRGIPRTLTQLPGNLAEGVAGYIGSGMQAVDAPFGGALGLEDTGKAISSLGTRAQKANTEFAEDIFGKRSEATKYSPTANFIAMAGEGVGSTLPYVITSGIGGTAANLSKTGRATRLAGGVPTAEKVAQRTNYLIAGAQGSQQAGQQAQEFREEGGTVSPLQELAARSVGTGLGLTEVGVANRMIERLPASARTSAIDSASNLVERATLGRVAPKEVFDTVKRAVAGVEARALGRTALSTVEESAQEAGVQLGQNLAAKAIYNPNQDAFEGVGESALLGGVVGGTISGGVETARKVLGSTPDQTGAPPPPRTPPRTTATPPADMGDLAQSLGPVGGTVTLQDAFGPQEYTFQGFDKKGKVILTDVDGVTLSEDPEWVRSAIGSAAVESDEGLGGMAFSTGIEEDMAAPPPPPPPPPPPASRTVFDINGKTYVQEGLGILTPEEQDAERAKIDEAIARINSETQNVRDSIQVLPSAFAPPTPPSPTATDTTGFAGMSSGMAGGMGENLRAYLLAKVEAGDTTEAGQPSVVLQTAKMIKDAGVPVDVGMLDRINAGITAARQSGDFQGSMRKFVADTVAQQRPVVMPPPIEKPKFTLETAEEEAAREAKAAIKSGAVAPPVFSPDVAPRIFSPPTEKPKFTIEMPPAQFSPEGGWVESVVKEIGNPNKTHQRFVRNDNDGIRNVRVKDGSVVADILTTDYDALDLDGDSFPVRVVKNNVTGKVSLSSIETGRAMGDITAMIEAGIPVEEAIRRMIDPEGPLPTKAVKTGSTTVVPKSVQPPSLPLPPPAPAAPRAVGKAARVTIPVNRQKFDVQYELQDMDNIKFAEDELQNRDRSRPASDAFVADTVNNFDPEGFGEDRYTDRGAPIINKDNTILSGNGRTLVLQEIYGFHPDKVEAYHELLREQGYDIEGIERPVLVRRLMSDADERKFVTASNESDVAALSPPEQAAQDASDILTPGVFAKFKGGELDAKKNDAFVSAFLAEMSSQQRKNAMDDKGKISAQGLKRIENALLYKAYGGNGRASKVFISKAMERNDDDTKTLTNALVDVSKDWIAFQQAIEAGEIDKKYNITDKLMETIGTASDIKASGNSVGFELRSPDMVEPMDPFVREILLAFHDDKVSRILSKKAIADKLRAYTEVAAVQQAEPDMLGMSETPSARDIWRRIDKGEGAPQSDLYASIAEPSTNLTDTPSSADIMALADELPAAQRVNVRASLNKILSRYEKNGTIDQLLGSLEQLYTAVNNRIKRNRAKKELDRVRGFERAMERSYRAEREGKLTPESAKLLRWILQKNPAIAEELALSFEIGGADAPAGVYSSGLRVATIFYSKANDGTAVHEVLHHTERLMPEKIRDGIRAEWTKRIKNLTALAERTGNTDAREVLGTIVRAYYGDSAARKDLDESYAAGTIPYSMYHLSNPSEFWAVNAAELVAKRAQQTGWTGAARKWLEGFIESAKDFFGLNSNSAVIKGLDAVLKEESGRTRGEMIASGGRKLRKEANQKAQEETEDNTQFRDIARPDEQSEEDFDTDIEAEPTPAKLSRVRQSINRLRTGAAWSNIASQFSGARAVDNWLARSYGLESLPETDSFYSNFETYLSKKNGKLQQLRRKFVDPIDDAVGDAIKNGVTMDDINDAIQARGAAERNAAIAEINKDMPDGGSGWMNAEADAKLRELQASGKMRYINRVVRLHDRLRNETQDMMVRDGLISAETMAEWKKKYPNYTPYKGWAPAGDMAVDGQEDPHADYGSYDKGSPVYSRVAGLRAKPVKAAKGRSSQAANSLYNMIADAEMFLEMGQRNQIALQLNSTYQNDPEAFTGLLKIYDKNNPKIIKGKAVKITDERAFKNGIRGFKNGEPFIIDTAPNEEGKAVRRAFTNLDPIQLNNWVDRFIRLMGVMRGLHTRFNAAFWPREFLRSISDAVGNVYTEKGRKRSAAYGKSAAMKTWRYSWDPATQAGVFAHLINKDAGSGRIAHVKALTEEMVVNGGAAGQEFAERAERVAKRMEAELDRMTATGVKAGYFETKAGFAKLIKVVDGINDFVDIVPRVAAYRALTEAGLSPKDAAQIALRSTLDMSKRGRFGRIIDSVFWWTTPSITNLTKKITGLDSSTYRKLVLAQLSIGFALGMLNIMNAPDSDDDGEDDYSQLPEWRKLAYLHVYYSPDKEPFTAPVGFLFLFERYVGGKMAEVLAGQVSDGKAAVDIMTASQDVGVAFLASLSPVVRSTEARTLVPSSIAPLYDLNVNESFFKAPIYNEPFDDSEAQASRAKRTTPEVYKIIAKGLQEASGGYGRIPGDIDVSPDQLKYFVDQYAGGVGRLVSGAAEGDIEALKKLNPFYFDPKLVEYAPMSRFYERQPEMKRAIAAEKLADDGDSSERDFLENNNPVALDSSVISAYRDADKKLKDLRKDANEMDPKEYKAEQLSIMSEFNQAYNDAKGGDSSYSTSAYEDEEFIPEEDEEGDE